ncbi:glycosyltransferase [Niabella sp. 22666]|uniref:glycosyltransferase n=1 Tax=Niabella sp. 22666 TaxID=3453954 RepID=UPI003F857045
MKILHVINSLEIGGAEKLLVDIVPIQQEQYSMVSIAVINKVESPFQALLTKINNLTVIPLGNGSYFSPFVLLKLMKLIRQYDIIHVHLFPAQYLVVIAKMFSASKTPLIFSEHSTHNRRREIKFFRFLDKIFYSFYKKIICITKEVAFELSRVYGISNDKLPIVHNGVNIATIEQTKAHDRSALGLYTSDTLLIMVAAFRKEKDHESVVRALASLPETFKLIFVGSGAEHQKIERLVNEMELNDRVIFLGQRGDVFQLIKMCDLAILSSHWEGFGLSAVEAMACGVPLIASDVSGLSQVVADGGLTFETGNEKDLVEKIKYLFENKEQKDELVRLGKKRANSFDISFMVDQMHNVYNSVLKTNQKY